MSEKKPLGRPCEFTQEIADLICERTATSTLGLKRLCKMYDDMPTHDTVYQWRYRNKAFSDQYARAKVFQAELLAEEIIEISDDGTNDWMESLSEEEQGLGWRLNGEHFARSRLRIDTRKWHASKLVPKIYGNPKDDDAKEKSQAETYVLRKV